MEIDGRKLQVDAVGDITCEILYYSCICHSLWLEDLAGFEELKICVPVRSFFDFCVCREVWKRAFECPVYDVGRKHWLTS